MISSAAFPCLIAEVTFNYIPGANRIMFSAPSGDYLEAPFI